MYHYLVLKNQKEAGGLVDKEFDIVKALNIKAASKHGQVFLMIPSEMLEGFKRQNEIAKKRRQG